MKRLVFLLLASASSHTMEKRIDVISQKHTNSEASLHQLETRVGILENSTTARFADEHIRRNATNRAFAEHIVRNQDSVMRELQCLEQKNIKRSEALSALHEQRLAASERKHAEHEQALKALHDKTAEHTNQISALQAKQEDSALRLEATADFAVLEAAQTAHQLAQVNTKLEEQQAQINNQKSMLKKITIVGGVATFAMLATAAVHFGAIKSELNEQLELLYSFAKGNLSVVSELCQASSAHTRAIQAHNERIAMLANRPQVGYNSKSGVIDINGKPVKDAKVQL